MMKRVYAVIFAAAFASPLAAQSTDCPAGGYIAPGVPDRQKATQDACQQAQDLFQLMAPQLGLALTGGNATLGQGGTMGGLGHFSVGIRANVLAGTIPVFDTISTSYNGRVQRSSYQTRNQILGLPAVDASIGIFKGLPLGVTNVGGVDLLLSATYIPKVNSNNVMIEPDNPLKVGYGVRVGLLQESLIMPGVSVTFLKRDLPRTTITGLESGDSLIVRDLDVKTTAWRVVASKSLIVVNIAAGVGQDKYDASTTAQAVVSTSPIGGAQSDAIALSQTLTRTNYFADLTMNLFVAKLIAEVGMASGGTVTTYNTFDSAPDKSRLYGSLGFRVGF